MTVLESEHHGLNLLNEHVPHYMLETACLIVTKICLLIKVRTVFAQHPPGNRQLATLHNFHPATGSYSHAAQRPPGNRQLATLHVVHARKIAVSLRQAVDVVAVEVVVCFPLPRFEVPRGRWSASGFHFLVLMSLQVCLWVPFSVTPLASGLPLGSTLCYSCRFRSTSGFHSLLLLSLQAYLWVPLSVTSVASDLPLGFTLWYSSSFRSNVS